jgi:hypothetical protein
VGQREQGRSVPEYRAYVLGSQGQILKADNDDLALEYARKNVLHRSIEVWQGERLVGTARHRARREQVRALRRDIVVPLRIYLGTIRSIDFC